MPKKGGTGGAGMSKKDAGQARKAEQEAAKKAEEQRKREAMEEAEWQKGANSKKASRDEAAAQKADEAAQKRREKAALLAAEEEALAKGGTAKKAPGGAAPKNKKKKPQNDLALLESALVSAADKKVRKKKEEERKKKEEEELQRRKKEEEDAKKSVDPLFANTEKMIGGAVLGDGDSSDDIDVGRQANVKRMQDEGVSGIDAALGSLNVSVPGQDTQVKSAKALYNEFETRMLPQVKDDYPGLRLTQYKEKVWNLWKKSPENPANQVPPS